MVSLTLHFQLHPIKSLIFGIYFYFLVHILYKICFSKRQLSVHFKSANSFLLSQKPQEL